MSFEIKKIYTENPYVDEMVYYTKLLASGTVLKFEDKANSLETVESLKRAGLYISCVEGTAIFELFDQVTRAALNAAGIIDEISVNSMLVDKYKIPMDRRPAVLSYMVNDYINNYEELNPYYRSLHGLPKIGGHRDYLIEGSLPKGYNVDYSKPIHEYSRAEAAILTSSGLIDDIIKGEYVYSLDATGRDVTESVSIEDRQYLYHIGNKAIDYYTARKANRFDTLYIPSIDSDAIYKMYKDKLDENKFYILRTVYSEAFKYNSDYYDNFIAVLIVIITMVDIISRVQEFVVRKEIFDIRSVQYIFESNGVPFFEDIPLRYQISMVKNLHTLLKFKSTARCMVDICSLFGFDNIQIFKYYLLKDREIDLTTGEYVSAFDENGNEDLEKEYTLRFLKLPLEANLDDYIRNGSSYLDYDEIVMQDPSWDGGIDHDEVIKTILEQEFNLIRTKYISIDSITDIAKASAQQSYFLNFLYDNVDIEDAITIKIPYIEAGRDFKLVDVFTLLTALTYRYNGVKDTIMDTQSKVLYVNGFNFKANLAVLAEEIGPKRIPDTPDGYIVDPGSTLHAQEQLAAFTDIVDDYVETTRVYDDNDPEKYSDKTKVKASIPSFKELMNIYVNSMEVRDELIIGMKNADNKRVYDVYKKLYDALMTVQLTMDFYKNPETGDFYRDDEGDATYSAYLAAVDPALYMVILETENYVDETSKTQYIANVIDSITYALEEYIDTKEFAALFSNLPVLSIDAVKNYIATVINFYKSYKVDFLGINTIYTFDDRGDEGSIRIIDDMLMHRFFQRSEFIKLYEDFRNLSSMNYRERIDLIDRIYLDISTWVYKHYESEVHINEKIARMLVTFVFGTLVYLVEAIDKEDVSSTYFETIHLMDGPVFISHLNHKDEVWMRDKLWIYLEGQASIYADFMDKVPPYEVGKIIIADETGNAKAGSYIVYDITSGPGSDGVVTEKAVADYVTGSANVVNRDDVVKSSVFANSTPYNSSNERVPSEKAIIDALSVKYYKAT